MENTTNDLFGDPIYTYTGEQAVEDGFLIDVSQLAKEAGFKWPVRITDALHHTLTPPKKSNQDYTGRLWDVLHFAAVTCKNANPENPGPIEYQLKIGARLHTLWICLDTTNGYPALHIMHPSDY